MYSNHPFLSDNGSSNSQLLPPQALPLKQKDEEFGIQCMDALEFQGRMQWLENQKYYTNYKLVNGEFIPSEYGLEEEFKDSISQMSADFNVPSFIKNYDIISQPINTMVGELDAYPDTLRVIGKGEKIDNERMRVKSSMLKDYTMSRIEAEINMKLIEKGLDPNFEEFETEEEKQAYQQQVTQVREDLMNPMQIQKYINTSYRHQAEIWGSTELEDQKQRFNLYDMRRLEFKDLLTTGKRFRHIYLKADGFGVESLNPINVFYHKSPEVKFIQDGDYAGQIHILSSSAIIDRYGYLMTKKQIESLQADYENVSKKALVKTALNGDKINYNSPSGIPYATIVPSLDRWVNEFMPQVKDYPASSNFLMTPELLDQINGGSNYISAINGMYQVTLGYWTSQKRIGKLVWINPETNTVEKIIVDESFYLPSYVKEVDGTIDFKEDDKINTITWTYVPEIWSGVKISNAGTHTNLEQPIYLNVGRHEIQGKGETMLYGTKLPILGQVINNRNTVSSSLVDLLKPYQFLYNVLMNQVYQYLEKEIMPFLILDSNALPNDKDWGGKKNLEKWLTAAKAVGVVPMDTSPANLQGANAGGQLPKVIDMDMSNRMLTRINVAQTIKQLALEQIGIAPQRLGDIKSSETATGINQASQRSYTQTSSWFTEFFAGEREMMKAQLDVAQVLQSKNKDITASMTKSDMSNNYVKFNDNEFSLYDLHIYVTNSQEELRKIELVRKLGVENNTLMTKLSDRIKMATDNSIPEIVNIILSSEAEEMEMRKQDQAQKQQQLEQQQQQFEAAQAKQEKQFYAKLETDKEIAYIKSMGFNENLGEDDNANTIPDVLEQLKYISSDSNAKAKLANEGMKIQNASDIAQQQLQIQREELQNDRVKEKNKQILEREKLKRAKVQGDKSK